MADRSITVSNTALTQQAQPVENGLHYIMGYIAAVWPNFGSSKAPAQKRLMITVWEQALQDIPVKLQKAAIDAKIRAGQLFPPSSPAELRVWCNEIQRPMDDGTAKWYADMAELGFFDPDFCQRQIDKYEAAKKEGRNAYAGWE